MVQNIIYLIIHIIFALGIFISFKVADIRKLDKFKTILVNYAIAIILSILDMGVTVGGITDYFSAKLIAPSIIIGFLFALNFVLMLLSTHRVGLGLTTALNKMSVVIPASLGILILGQNTHYIVKITGIVLALLSFVLILYKSRGRAPWLSYLLPAGVFIVSGVIDSSMEFSQRFIITDSDQREFFLFGLFFSAFMFTILFSWIEPATNKDRSKFSYDTVVVGMMLGLFNYLTSKMVLVNVDLMGGSVVFPVHNASVVMLTSFIGFFFFKEKFSNMQWTGIALAVISVALIASTM